VGGRAAGAGFDRTRRLLVAGDYSRVFDAPDCKASHRNVLLLARCNRSANHRLGLVISKKNVPLAVDRNRIKRIARESFRQLPQSERSVDVVLLARRGLGELGNPEIFALLERQWQKILQPSNTARPPEV